MTTGIFVLLGFFSSNIYGTIKIEIHKVSVSILLVTNLYSYYLVSLFSLDFFYKSAAYLEEINVFFIH